MEKVGFVGFVVSPVVEEHYLSKANREVMSLYDLIAFAVIAHRYCEGCIRGRIGSS